MKRISLLIAAAALLVLGSSVPGRAQIMYPLPYRYAYADASVRIEAAPKEAEVYVDGFYAGIVDDFDGVFQRLNIAPGQHEIVIYLNGYRSVHERVFLMPERTFHIKTRLEPLAAGENAEPRPSPLPSAITPDGPDGPDGPRTFPPRPLPGGPGRGGRRGQAPQNAPEPPNGPGAGAPPPAQAGVGTLSIQLQPVDADVLIDGQPWPAGSRDRFVVDVAEGRHVVQVRKAGYVGYLTEVGVRRGETTTITVNLRVQP
jgi:hypothetical protein